LEKTPTHMFHVDEIKQAVPGALFVELVRDPRDILASKAKRQSEDWIGRFVPEKRDLKRFSSGFDPLWDTLGWMSAIRAGDEARKKHPSDICRVRYEDFVTNPEGELERICQFLGLEFSPSMLNVPWTNAAVGDVQDRQGIRTAPVGRFQGVLAPEAVALCQAMVKREMDTLGYAPAPVTFAAYLRMPILAVRSGFEFWVRLYRRWRLGGAAYLVNVLGKYWRRLVGLTTRRRASTGDEPEHARA
jgi:hypothetical protein